MYCTLTEAQEYLMSRYSKLPDSGKLSNSLYRAYDKIEEIDIRNSGETANFPRIGEETVPSKIIQAQIEEAYSISMMKNEIENNSNVKSRSDGDMSVTFVENTLQGVQFNSRIAYSIMKKFKRKSYG